MPRWSSKRNRQRAMAAPAFAEESFLNHLYSLDGSYLKDNQTKQISLPLHSAPIQNKS